MLQKRCKVTAFFFTAKLFNLFFNKKTFRHLHPPQLPQHRHPPQAPARPPLPTIYKGRNTANIENGSAVGVMKPAATSNTTMAWRR